jgi:hypothetical protein
MLEAHAPHTTVRSWKDFLVHIATITIGLLIAIALEQCVESLHQLHQRHQLEHDLLEEAKRNRDILADDLKLESEGAWFQAALAATRSVTTDQRTPVTLPRSPCIPGTVGANGTDEAVHSTYFMPSDAVWVTARDAGLIIRLPVAEARMYARLAHNYVLQAAARDRFAYACERVDVLRTRYADGVGTTWVLNGNQANELADAAATADSALRALLWRSRWNLKYEDGILRGARDADEVLKSPAAKSL